MRPEIKLFDQSQQRHLIVPLFRLILLCQRVFVAILETEPLRFLSFVLQSLKSSVESRKILSSIVLWPRFANVQYNICQQSILTKPALVSISQELISRDRSNGFLIFVHFCSFLVSQVKYAM